MKIHLICTLTLSALICIGCNSNKQKGDDELPSESQENIEQPEGDISGNADSMPTATEQDTNIEMVTASIPIKSDFYSITNLSNINIEYEQGDPHILFEGSSTVLQNLRYDYDGGVLTLRSEGSKDEFSKQIEQAEKATIHISNKELRIVAVCGAGSFSCHTPFRSTQFQAGCMGSGSITIDQIDCQTFRYEATGPGKGIFGNIRADEVKLLQYGTGPIEAIATAKTEAIIDLGNTGDVKADVTAPSVATISSGAGKLDLHVQADRLEASVLGNGTTTLSGHANQTKFKNTPTGKIVNNLQ